MPSELYLAGTDKKRLKQDNSTGKKKNVKGSNNHNKRTQFGRRTASA